MDDTVIPQFTIPHVLSYSLQSRKAMLKHMNSCQHTSGKPWIFNSENGNINFRKILLSQSDIEYFLQESAFSGHIEKIILTVIFPIWLQKPY